MSEEEVVPFFLAVALWHDTHGDPADKGVWYYSTLAGAIDVSGFTAPPGSYRNMMYYEDAKLYDEYINSK